MEKSLCTCSTGGTKLPRYSALDDDIPTTTCVRGTASPGAGQWTAVWLYAWLAECSIHGNLSQCKWAKLKSTWVYLRHFLTIYNQMTFNETNINHIRHTTTVFIIQLLTKNKNYSAKHVLQLEEGKDMILTCRGTTGQLPLTERAGAPSERSWPLWVWLALPKCSCCQASPLSPATLCVLQNRDQGFPQPGTESLNGKSTLIAWDGGELRREPQEERTAGLRSCYRMYQKGKINIIQSSCCHSKRFKNSPWICFQSQDKGHTRNSIFLLYRNIFFLGTLFLFF